MSKIIEVSGLTKKFAKLTAVNNISFSVQKGCCFGLLGPNGAGKTTTLEMMEGIISPTSGAILFDGEPATDVSFQRFGIQFQHTALQDYMTVKETLLMFAAFYDAPANIDDLITTCDLSELLDRDHSKLSGGQRQRLLLALALINNPDVVFLDEPTTGLDPHARRDFWALIKRVKKQGKSIVLTTHYMDEAEQLCDEIVIMDRGKIIEQGGPSALLNKHFSGVMMCLPKENLSNIELDMEYLEQEHSLEIHATDVESTLTALIQKNVPLQGLQIKSATLDDLFLKLTGHGLMGDEHA